MENTENTELIVAGVEPTDETVTVEPTETVTVEPTETVTVEPTETVTVEPTETVEHVMKPSPIPFNAFLELVRANARAFKEQRALHLKKELAREAASETMDIKILQAIAKDLTELPNSSGMPSSVVMTANLNGESIEVIVPLNVTLTGNGKAVKVTGGAKQAHLREGDRFKIRKSGCPSVTCTFLGGSRPQMALIEGSEEARPLRDILGDWMAENGLKPDVVNGQYHISTTASPYIIRIEDGK